MENIVVGKNGNPFGINFNSIYISISYIQVLWLLLSKSEPGWLDGFNTHVECFSSSRNPHFQSLGKRLQINSEVCTRKSGHQDYKSCSLGRVQFTDGPVRHWEEQNLVSIATFILRIDKETPVETSQWNDWQGTRRYVHRMHISKYFWIFRGKIRTLVDRVEITSNYIHAFSYSYVLSGQNKTLLKSTPPTEVRQISRFLKVKPGLLILGDGAISHNRPQIAYDRTIHEKEKNAQHP